MTDHPESPPLDSSSGASLVRRVLPLLCVLLIGLLGFALWRAIRHDSGESPAERDVARSEPSDDVAGKTAGDAASPGASDDAAKTATPPSVSPPSTPGESVESPPSGEKPSTPAPNAPAKPDGQPANSPPTPPQTPPPPPPWQATLDQAEPVKFSDIALDVFDVQRKLPARQELQRWFEPVAGHGLRMTEQNVAYGRFTVFEGTMRLRSPLGDGLALHLMLDSYVRLVIHCYAGRRGVTLVSLADDSDRWVAYATERNGGGVSPDRWAWTASDDGRVRRSGVRNAGAIQLRHQDGELLLTHGDVLLVRAPLAEKPDEIYLTGRVMPLGIELLKTKDFAVADLPPENAPAEGGAAGPLAVDEIVRNGAELAWSGAPAAATKAEAVDGVWRFSADKADKRGWLATPLPGDGLYETILELGEVTPGVGLFLSDGVAPPTQTLRFVTDTKTGGLALMPTPENDTIQNAWPPPTENASPLVDVAPWVRIISGAGGARWWISVDGVHWAEPPTASRLPWTANSHLGVQHVAGVAGTRLAIRSLRRRSLAALHALVSDEVRSKARPIAAPDQPTWEAKMAAAKPADVELPAWRRASAIRTLAAGTLDTLGPQLVDLLLDDAAQNALPLARQLRLLAEAQRLLDVRHQPALAVALATRYHKLGLDAFARHGDYPVSAVRPAFLSTSFESRHAYPLSDPQAIRSELLARLYDDDWEGVVDFCRRTRFHNQHLQTPIFEWADALARRTTPTLDKPAAQPLGVANRGRSLFFARRGRFPGASGKTKLPWQHPLVEELSKETYNALAELQGMLDGQAYDDAARTIVTLDPTQMPGVAPAGDDGQLLLTLAAAVRRSARQHPPLAAALEKHFGQVAPLRVRQAILSSDPDGVQRVAMLFPGTAAAAEAHRWLGDHALALGWFALARAEYRRGVAASPDETLRSELSAHLRLAAALAGQDEGTPLATPIQLGPRNLSAGEFEALVTEVRQRAGARTSEPQTFAMSAPTPAPPPGPRSTPVRAVVDGPLGENPAEEATPNLNRFLVDWPARQLAQLVVGDRLLVNNRFHLASYDLSSGQRLWQTAAPAGKKSGKSREWALMPMHPLVVGNRVFARQLLSDGPVLGCWDLTTGQPQWLADTVKGLQAVSDPLMIQGRLAALCATRGENSEWSLRFVTFDADRGEPLEQIDLLKLHHSWLTRKVCLIRPLDDGFVASLGGVVVRCDGWARVLWIRRQVVLPADEEPQWVTQWFEPPLVQDGQLFVAQPGVRAIECIDAETGQLTWRRCLPDVRRIVGVLGDKLLAAQDGGFVALDRRTGQVVWRHAAADATAEALIGGPGGFAYVVQRRAADGKRLQSGLVWVNGETGRTASEQMFAALDDDAPRVGPFVSHQNRWWTFFGRGQNEAKRDLLELAP